MKKERISGVIFNESSCQWNKDNMYNLMFLRAQQNYWNDVLAARGHVFLNEVYDALGFARTKKGHLSGWLKGDNGFVDFNVREINEVIELTFDVIENLHEIAFEIEA